MDEQLKDRILIALVILTLICLVLAISSSMTVQRYKKDLQREMVLRLDAEEKLVDLAPKVSELENIKTNLEGMSKALDDQKIINQELRSEYEKMEKLKEALEEDLKEALIRCRK